SQRAHALGKTILAAATERHEATADDRHRAKLAAALLQAPDHMRPGRLAHPQRYLDNAALDELLTPGVGDALRAGGDDDPVEGRAGGEPLPAHSHHHTCAVPACPKRSTR